MFFFEKQRLTHLQINSLGIFQKCVCFFKNIKLIFLVFFYNFNVLILKIKKIKKII